MYDDLLSPLPTEKEEEEERGLCDPSTSSWFPIWFSAAPFIFCGRLVAGVDGIRVGVVSLPVHLVCLVRRTPSREDIPCVASLLVLLYIRSLPLLHAPRTYTTYLYYLLCAIC